MPQLFAAISVPLFLLAAPPYILDTVRGKTKPERATWFIFSLLGLIAFVSQVMLGATWSLVFLGLDMLASIITFGLSIRFGVGGWSRADQLALIIAAIGVGVSIVAQQPLVALLGAIMADASGTVLTIIKTFHEPDTETTISWLLTGTGALCGMLSVGRLDVALLLYPTYLAVANYIVPVTQLVSRMYTQANRRTV